MKNLIIIFVSTVLVVRLDAIPVEIVQKNIPVEIRYDQIIPGIVSREQVLVHGRRNLEPKVQLSSDELPQALKHLPLQAEPDILAEAGEENLQLSQDDDGSILKTIILPEKQAETDDVVPEKPVEVPVNNELPAIKSLLDPEENIQEKSAKTPLEKILSESQNIINNGLKDLKESFTTGKGEFSPSEEQWAGLEKQVNEYFNEEKNKLLVKQAQTETTAAAGSTAAPAAQPGQSNWFVNLATGVSNIATNFMQNFQNLGGNNSGAAPGAQGDEGTGPQQPANQGLQNFISFMNTGFGNLVSTITGTNNQGPTTSNTNLSDSGSATPGTGGPGGFFGSVITNVQNALGIQPGQGPAGVQGDSGAQQQQPGPGQFIQNFGSAISNFFQGGNRPPANAQGDTGTSPTQPTNNNNNFIQNIQNAFLNNPLNPFRPQGQNPQNPIQTAAQNAGAQIQQIIPGGSTPAQPQTDDNKPISENVPTEGKPAEVVLPGEDIKPVNENELKKQSNSA